MKLQRRITLFCLLAALCQGCVNDGAKQEFANLGTDIRSKHASTSANTQILVTFRDERIDHVPVGDAVNAYRARGNYGNSTWSERIASNLAETYGLSQVAQWPVTTLGVHCVVYEIPATKSTAEVLRQLGADSRVSGVQTMKQFQVMNSPINAYSDPYFKLQAGLREMHLGDIHQKVTGRNIKIAVIDTGVDVHHQDLNGQLDRVENYVPETAEDSSGDMHGTAIAGIIAAIANNGRGIVGIAPDAKLISLKACWQQASGQPEAQCNTFTLALALNNAILMKPQILNMSLSGPEDPLLSQLIQKAMDEGIIVVASAASNPDGSNLFPSSMKGVIGVQSVPVGNVSGVKSVNLVAAPGNEILTTLPHDGYSFMTGSSFAAAHVSGVIALLLEKQPRLSSNQVFNILKTSSESNPLDKGVSHSINVCTAVAQVGAFSPGCEDNKTIPPKKSKTSQTFASRAITS